MSDLNPKPVEIEYKGKVYKCLFTLNCIDEVQEHFDASLTDVINMIADGKQTARNVRFLVTLLLNESVDAKGEEFDEMDVGAAIDIRNFNYYCMRVLEALGVSLPDDDGDDLPEAAAGQVCCVSGLSIGMPGDRLGADSGTPTRMMRPCYACRLVLAPGTDIHYALDCMKVLEEEEPLIQAEYIEAKREIRVHSMGDVYLEVLARQLKDRFGIEASFADSSVLYRETIEAPVEGVGHYEPLRHYAEVHLLLSPLPRGSGLQFDSTVHVDDLALNWQRLIMTHLREKTHVGVLTGSPITDMRITLVAGKAHLKHTEGGDFRQATYRALRQGLMKAKSILLEPWMRLEITVPEENTGRVMSDLTAMGGRFDAPEDAGGTLRRLEAAAPAGACASYGREVNIFTKGRGSVSASFLDWEPCADAEKVIAEKGYNPERDTWNSADSVFCSHGAGVTVGKRTRRWSGFSKRPTAL